MKIFASVFLVVAVNMCHSLSASATAFPLEVVLNENKSTMDLRPVKVTPGSVILCETLGSTGLFCDGFISDVVMFGGNSATLHSDVANESGPTEPLPLPPADDGNLDYSLANSKFIQEDATGVTT